LRSKVEKQTKLFEEKEVMIERSTQELERESARI